MFLFSRAVFFIFLFLTASRLQARLHVDIQSESALLINAKTGKVLFAKNASKPLYPASCTKVAFALYAIKNYKSLFNKTLSCSQNALKALPEVKKAADNFSAVPSYVLEFDASHMGLKVGEEMTFYDLLEATVVVSADDASNMLAEVMGEGSIDACVEKVNAYLTSIGCKNTHFTNPHGLHHPDHVTTAEDLALMCREAMKEPLFAKMAKMTSYNRPLTNKQESVVLKQTNRLLSKSSSYYYPAANGIKTGYHRRAGYCLTSHAEQEGRSLIAVVLHAETSKERFEDTIRLFEAAFKEELVKRELFPKGAQSFEKKWKKAKTAVKTETRESLAYTFYPSEEPKVSCLLAWHEAKLPLKKGSIVGEIQLFEEGKISKRVSLFAANDVEMTFLASLLQNRVRLIVLGIFAVVLLFFLFRKRR